MEIKGTAFLTRMQQAVAMKGEGGWDAFLHTLRQKDPYFVAPVLATTQIPVERWLTFMDLYVAHYFTCSRDEAYWKLGEGSAAWALSPGGPYALLIPKNNDVRALVEKSWPKMFRTYFSTGTIVTKLEGNVAHCWSREVPMHAYFEMLMHAYFKKSLELMGLSNITARRIKGADSPDGEMYYQLEFTPR
jgi:hypothetical protein